MTLGKTMKACAVIYAIVAMTVVSVYLLYPIANVSGEVDGRITTSSSVVPGSVSLRSAELEIYIPVGVFGVAAFDFLVGGGSIADIELLNATTPIDGFDLGPYLLPPGWKAGDSGLWFIQFSQSLFFMEVFGIVEQEHSIADWGSFENTSWSEPNDTWLPMNTTWQAFGAPTVWLANASSTGTSMLQNGTTGGNVNIFIADNRSAFDSGSNSLYMESTTTDPNCYAVQFMKHRVDYNQGSAIIWDGSLHPFGKGGTVTLIGYNRSEPGAHYVLEFDVYIPSGSERNAIGVGMIGRTIDETTQDLEPRDMYYLFGSGTNGTSSFSPYDDYGTGWRLFLDTPYDQWVHYRLNVTDDMINQCGIPVGEARNWSGGEQLVLGIDKDLGGLGSATAEVYFDNVDVGFTGTRYSYDGYGHTFIKADQYRINGQSSVIQNFTASLGSVVVTTQVATYGAVGTDVINWTCLWESNVEGSGIDDRDQILAYIINPTYFGHMEASSSFSEEDGRYEATFSAPNWDDFPIMYELSSATIVSDGGTLDWVFLEEDGVTHLLTSTGSPYSGDYYQSGATTTIAQRAFLSDFFTNDPDGYGVENLKLGAYPGADGVDVLLTDQHGEPIPNTIVTLTHVDLDYTEKEITAKGDEDEVASDVGAGIASFGELPSGEYFVEVSGYGMKFGKGFILDPGEDIEIVISLEIDLRVLINVGARLIGVSEQSLGLMLLGFGGGVFAIPFAASYVSRYLLRKGLRKQGILPQKPPRFKAVRTRKPRVEKVQSIKTGAVGLPDGGSSKKKKKGKKLRVAVPRRSDPQQY